MNPGDSITCVVRVLGQPDHPFDGLVRRAYLTHEPDTFFSQPARVSLGGRKLRGFVTCDSDDAGDRFYVFCPFTSQLSL